LNPLSAQPGFSFKLLTSMVFPNDFQFFRGRAKNDKKLTNKKQFSVVFLFVFLYGETCFDESKHVVLNDTNQYWIPGQAWNDNNEQERL